MIYFHFQTLSSTQDKAFELLESESFPLIVTTDEQTKGRGRLQRVWVHEKNRSLAMTVGFKMSPSKMSGLSLVAGLACVKALAIPNLFLKWPNDLMLEESKVGGILVESKISGNEAVVALGIGINMSSLENAPYQGIEKKIRVEDLAETIWNYLQLFFENGFIFFKNDYLSCLWKKNQSIQMRIQEEIMNVKILGVDDDGALLVDQDGKILMHDSGEILFGGAK